MGLVMEMVTDKLQQLCKVKPESDGRQTYSLSRLISSARSNMAIWLRTQEPTTIIQPGVLVGPNSLLEQGDLSPCLPAR